LSGQFLADVIRYQLESRDGQWRLQFDFEQAALERLLGRRLGRTVLLTNRLDWTPNKWWPVMPANKQVERVFRGLKDGRVLGWGTDASLGPTAKIPHPCRLLACLGISLLQYVHRQAKAAWSDLSMDNSSKSCSRFSSSFCSTHARRERP